MSPVVASQQVVLCVTYAPHEYSSLRQQFLPEKTLAGMSAKEAREEWDMSDVKRRLLSGVSLPELKRRRFVPKDCQVNPCGLEILKMYECSDSESHNDKSEQKLLLTGYVSMTAPRCRLLQNCRSFI